MNFKKSLATFGMVATIASTIGAMSVAHAAPGFRGIKRRPAVRVTRPGERKPVVKKTFSRPKRRIVQIKG
jgi:hypothetical protein